jgi:outer membrane protein OmpA-like peptidoglycan-associated protein
MRHRRISPSAPGSRFPRALVLGAALLALTAGACAPIPRPRVLDEADRVSEAPAVIEAKRIASGAWALAEKLRTEAHHAADDGHTSRAQWLAEESLAAYAEAVDASRKVKGVEREQRALVEIERNERELAEVDAEQARLGTEVEVLELRLKVARDAESPAASGAASGPREAARREAARAMRVEARLLCAAARILAPKPASAPASPGASAALPASSAASLEDPSAPAAIARDLTQAEAWLTELEGALDAEAERTVAPIDLATRARASCLSVLTRARRAGGATAAQAGVGEQLLGELTAYARRAGGLSAQRDERGVVVVLGQVFDRDQLRPEASLRLAELDRVARAHPSFPVAIVVHTDKPVSARDEAAWQARAARVAEAFASRPTEQRIAIVAGNSLPLVDHRAPDRAKNARVEIVFLTPEAL